MLSNIHYIITNRVLSFQDSGLVTVEAVIFLAVQVEMQELSFNPMRRVTALARAASLFYYSAVEARVLDPYHVTQLEMLAAAQDRDFALQALKRLLLTECSNSAFFYLENFDCDLFLSVQVCSQFNPKTLMHQTLTLHSDHSQYSSEASSGHQVLSLSKSLKFPIQVFSREYCPFKIIKPH